MLIQIQWLLPPQPQLLTPSPYHRHRHRRNLLFSYRRRNHSSTNYFSFQPCNCIIHSSVSEESKEAVKIRAYPFHEIEPRWQKFWDKNRTFRTPDDVDTSKPKFYVLDMFPYPRYVNFITYIYLCMYLVCRILMLYWNNSVFRSYV